MNLNSCGFPRSGRPVRTLGICGLSVVLSLALFAMPAIAGAAQRALMRFPTLHADTIVFSAAGNLWRVDRKGGVAQRLTTDSGLDIMPRFSPDGKEIAFTGEYDGNRDVYVIPAEGGPVRRLTFHSDVVPDAPMRWGPDNMVVTWTPDGKNIMFLSRRATYHDWFGQLFLVPREGGTVTQFPVDKGGVTSFSPDGSKIAYNRIFRNFRTWKRYYGGLAQDVWTYDLKTHDIQRVTDWKGTDTYPMWYRDSIYFASDRGPERRLNIWAYDLKTKQFRQVTQFKDYDVDWPSLGDTGIVFSCGGELYVLDLPSEKLEKVEVDVPNDSVRTRPRWMDASKAIQAFDIAPNGKRALFEARGDVFTVPAEHGNTRDLTQTSGVREQDPAWSPDGKWVAYVTDRSGEAQIAVRPSDGTGSEQILTDRGKGYIFDPAWSPDSEKIAFDDSDHVLWVVNVKDRKVTKVDSNPRAEMHDFAWSPDALWLAYSKAADNDLREIYLYDLTSAKATQVTRAFTSDFNPTFDPQGKYLYFIALKHANPVFSESEFNVATVKMAGIYVVTLQATEPSPFAPRSDEGTPKEEKKKKEEAKDETWKPGASAPIKIDLAGLADRVVPLPVPAGEISHLSAARGRVFYLTQPLRSFETALHGEEPELHAFDLDKRKDAVLVSPLDEYALSADGTAVLTKNKDAYAIGSTAAEAKDMGEAKPKDLDLSHMQALIDPVAEWNEMFQQAWRLERDFFYRPEMNGVNWPAIRASYEKLLPRAASRDDLNYLIGEMLGELGNSHTYVGGGDELKGKRVPTGGLGVDFGVDEKAARYFFKTIYPGDNAREGYRSPLTEPGINVREGNYLLAVNGHELRVPTDPDTLFVNTLEGTVTLTVADDASGKNRRDVTVKPVANELNLRMKAWIDHNREKVDKASGGAIGYLYLADMDEQGMEQFINQFYPQVRKQGLIVDVRYNGGGFIDQIVLERLRRVLVGMDTNRQGVPVPIPQQMMHGAMVCLLNHYSASDGDVFPYYFKKYGLGPLIGERTWGGVRGIRGYWPLADGGYVTIPEDSLYGLDSQWVIENHGVDPDIEVDNLPGDVMAGKDAQLETAIKYVMDKIKANPMTLPPPPPAIPPYPPSGQ
jgi:tricorn protease